MDIRDLRVLILGAGGGAGLAIQIAAQLRRRTVRNRTQLRFNDREVRHRSTHMRFERPAHHAQVLRRRAAAAADDARPRIQG